MEQADYKAPKEEELFEQALELQSQSERLVFLRKHCGQNREMHDRLVSLLGATQAADNFFNETHTALEALLPRISPEEQTELLLRSDRSKGSDLLGKQIGRYRLTKLLGEGGWGAVYLAEQQEPVQRRVALKIIRGGMETSTIVARFESERQMLAMMDHPNIARVYDAGETDRGYPYFVMEFVQGEEITSYCDRNQLRIPERLSLFIQICNAIQHAHQKGVIHRDIKPSNIMVSMVDGKPVPKIIDFGIAKATEVRLSEKAMGTAFVQLIGTPAYMSPEQAELRWMDVDTRSDIYSLGVVLYELLCGCTPFEHKLLTQGGLHELRKILREKEPPRPSARLAELPLAERREHAKKRDTDSETLCNDLQGDLDWIIIRTLEKERDRRYETANGLALDIARHLNFEAVSARPPTLLYRTQKAMRRNRLLFASIAAIALVLVAGMSTSMYLLVKERQARQRAVEAERQQSRLRHEAESREKITQATMLINQERYEEANHLLQGLDINQPTVEGAAAVRALGEWHAIEGRYKEAALLFQQLLLLDTLDGWDANSLDALRLAPILVQAGNLVEYRFFRHQILDEYIAHPVPATDRVLKACMLAPIDEALTKKLSSLSLLSTQQLEEAEANNDAFQAAWISLSMSLWEFRRGDLTQAESWARKSLGYPGANAPRAATAHLVLALSLRAKGQDQEAQSEVSEASQLLDYKSRTPLGRGSPVQGFWFDWAIAKILLNEAMLPSKPPALQN